jgi:uncharacterized protein
MWNDITVIDADAHVIDGDDIYRKRLPEDFRNRFAVYPADGFDRLQNGTLLAKRPENVQKNLSDNDKEGIDIQILYPTGGLFLSRVRERAYSIAVAQAYNDWLHEWCSADHRRLKGVALVPLHVDVKAAIHEMERAVGKLGMVGVMVNTYDRTRNVAHEDFWPFYEECDRQGIPVSFHASGSDTLEPVCHFDNFLSIHALSHVPEQLIACTAVIYSGMLEVFSDLRVAFLEAGCGWIPFWMERLDEEWEKRAFDAPRLKAKPSDYMTCGRLFVSCESEEKTLPYVAQWIGEENILFASDYPHWDGNFPEAVSLLAERTDISAALKRKIFCENSLRYYGIMSDRAKD